MKQRSAKHILIGLPILCLTSTASLAQEAPDKYKPSYHGKITDYRAANTPVNYSYILLNAGKSDFDNYDQSLTNLGIAGQALLNKSYIFKIGYQASLLDKDNSGTELDYQSNRFNIGIAYRHAIFDSTDIEVDGQLLYNWDSNKQNDNTNEELGYIVGAYINQGIGDSFEGTLGITYSSEYSQESVNFLLSATQYITKYVGVGVDGYMGSANENSFSGDQLYLGAHVRLAFY